MSGIEWNNEICEKLIELVKDYRCLFDHSHKKYMDAQSCKDKWTTIRDNFRRYRNKLKTKSGQESKPTKAYKFAKCLEFLVPHMEERETQTNITLPVYETEPNKENDTQSTEEPEINHLQEKRPVSNSTTPSTKKIKTSSPSAAATLMTYLVEKKQTQSQPDAVELYLSSLAPVLRSLTPLNFCLAKQKLNAIVHEFELDQLTGSFTEEFIDETTPITEEENVSSLNI